MGILYAILITILLGIVICVYETASKEFASVDGMTWKFGSATEKDFPPDLEDIPVILWWTENLYPHLRSFEKRKCPNSSCYVTKERRFLSHPQTNVFYFYGTEFKAEDLPLPREPRHIWAIAHEESPLNNFVIDHAVGMNVFNYTATYNRHSDFPITTVSFPGRNFILDHKPVSTNDKNEYQRAFGFAPAVYVQSHCEVPSDRDRYVSELMQYIKIDSYGKCLHNKDLPEELQNPVENMFNVQFKELIAKYKFIISFENAICDDYMTEKLFRPLHVGSVPVYRGSPLAREFMPDNHSIIMVEDFESPKELAEFLLKLNENDEEYEKYLEFKQRKTITNAKLNEHLENRPWQFMETDDNYGPFFEDFECYLCDKANARYKREKEHAEDPSVPLLEPKLTDGRKFACPQPDTAFGEQPRMGDWWHRYNYPEQYWMGLDRARAMRDMLIAGETDNKKFKQYLEKYDKGSAVK